MTFAASTITEKSSTFGRECQRWHISWFTEWI